MPPAPPGHKAPAYVRLTRRAAYIGRPFTGRRDPVAGARTWGGPLRAAAIRPPGRVRGAALYGPPRSGRRGAYVGRPFTGRRDPAAGARTWGGPLRAAAIRPPGRVRG